MAEVELNEAAIADMLRHHPAIRDRLQDAVDFAQNHWAEHARHLTGRMGTETTAEVYEGPTTLEGVFAVEPFYSRFQNFGTQYIEGQQLLAEIRIRIESGAF